MSASTWTSPRSLRPGAFYCSEASTPARHRKKPRRDGGHKPGLRVPYGGTCDGEGKPITLLFYRLVISITNAHFLHLRFTVGPSVAILSGLTARDLRFARLRGKLVTVRKARRQRSSFLFVSCSGGQGRRLRSAPFCRLSRLRFICSEHTTQTARPMMASSTAITRKVATSGIGRTDRTKEARDGTAARDPVPFSSLG